MFLGCNPLPPPLLRGCHGIGRERAHLTVGTPAGHASCRPTACGDGCSSDADDGLGAQAERGTESICRGYVLNERASRRLTSSPRAPPRWRRLPPSLEEGWVSRRCGSAGTRGEGKRVGCVAAWPMAADGCAHGGCPWISGRGAASGLCLCSLCLCWCRVCMCFCELVLMFLRRVCVCALFQRGSCNLVHCSGVSRTHCLWLYGCM